LVWCELPGRCRQANRKSQAAQSRGAKRCLDA
jgi:hypothetical protein